MLWNCRIVKSFSFPLPSIPTFQQHDEKAVGKKFLSRRQKNLIRLLEIVGACFGLFTTVFAYAKQEYCMWWRVGGGRSVSCKQKVLTDG